MLSSIRIRLTVWYVSIFGLLLMIFTVNAYWLLADDIHQRFDNSLFRAARATASYFSEFVEKNNVVAGARETVRDSQFGELRPAILQGEELLAASGAEITSAITATRILTQRDGRDQVAFATDKSRNARLARVALEIGGVRYSIVVLEPLTEVDNQLARMRRVFFLGIPVALLLAACGGFVMAGKSLDPMVSISNQAERISAQNLSSRVEIPHPSDEVGQLAKVINALIGRLELSFRVMREFMADASHELRTPLAIIQGETEVTLSQDRTNAEYRRSLVLIGEQSRRMGRIVSDMLVLARADAGQKMVRLEEIYLNDLVEECCRAAQTLAGAARVRLDCETGVDVPFHGDPELLKRMILNLLDNAIHYTSAGGSVRVCLTTAGGSVRLIVSDTGVGIRAECQPRLFDRFYRGENPAGPPNGGSGLGLSIVKVAAESHRGTVELESEPGLGSTFTVTLPLS